MASTLTEKAEVLGRPKLTDSTLANVLVVLAILFIPLMYGGILSSAYQDPVNRISHMQAAVVNEDSPATLALVSGETETVDVGQMLTDALTSPEEGEDTGFTWTQMTRQQAEEDLENASIRAILYIPEGLSAEVGTIGTTDAAHTIPGRLTLVTDDGINYLSGTLARSVASQLEDRVQSEASEVYAEALLSSLGEIRTGMVDAADGATQVADGSATLSDGLSQLDAGAASAAEGSNQVSSGAGQLSDGLDELASQVPALGSGVDQLSDGSQQLASGAATLQAGIDQYTDGVAQVTSGANTLRAQTPQLQEGVDQLESGSSQLAAGSAQLDEQFHQISDPVAELAPIPAEIRNFVSSVTEQIDVAHERCVADLGEDDAACQLLSRLQEDQAEIVDRTEEVTGKADDAIAGVASAQEAMGQIAAGAAKVEEGTALLQDSVGTTADTAHHSTVLGAINAIDDGLLTLSANSTALREGSAAVTSGSRQLADGMGTLKSKVPSLVSGVNQLDDGAGVLADGASSLSQGLATLATGASDAAEGSVTLKEGTEELRDGLVQGSEQIPDYSDAEAAAIAQTSSSLIDVEPVRERAVNNSGAGFAPMFLSLALWIGGIAIFLVLPALDRRPGPGEAWWMAAVRPARTAALFGIAQAVLAVVLTDTLVELHAVNLWGLIGMGVLASLTFIAVNQASVAAFGYRGRFVSIVLLLLQIASMGATFPIETMPAFFEWIHPWLPMTYTQLSFRYLIAGGGVPGIVGKTVLVLLAWLVAAVVVVFWSAYRRDKYHPLPYDAALLPDNYPPEDEVTAAELANRQDLKRELVGAAQERIASVQQHVKPASANRRPDRSTEGADGQDGDH